MTSLLKLLPTNRDLHTLSPDEFNSLMDAGSPGHDLYHLLRHDVGLPRVATHKLFARKRPRLVPVRDTVVEGLLGLAKSPKWWQPWWEALSSDQRIPDRLACIRLKSEVSEVSLLRIADIVLWMQGTERDRNTASKGSPPLRDLDGGP